MLRLNYSFLSIIYTIIVLSGKRVEAEGVQTHEVENRDGFDAYISNFPRPSALSYHYNDNPVTWHEAFSQCVSTGGKLASPFNPPSHESLRTFMIITGIDDVNIWVGARVSEADENNTRVWYWETYDQSVLWTNFHPQPSTCSNVEEGHCLSAYRDSATAEFGWCGRPCGVNLTFICEFGTPPQPTTTTKVESTTSGAWNQTVACTEIFCTLILSVILFAMKRM